MVEGAEREFETGKGEAWTVNLKAVTDAFVNDILVSQRHAQQHFDSMMTDARTHIAEMNKLSLGTLRGAIRDSDVVANKLWNLEPSEAAAEAQVLPSVYLDAIKAIVVATLTELGIKPQQ